MSDARIDFDPAGPLPGPGVTVLEASAGTGKTHTVATIVARLLAEGTCRTEDLLVVTFTRAATGELRDRTRRRLVSTCWELEHYLATGTTSQDHLARLLVQSSTSTADLRERWLRLSEALADFDRATITTTHGFCHLVLAALGVWGEVAPGASLLEAPEDMVREVSDDLYARWVVMHGPLPFRPAPARAVAGAAVAHPGLPVLPVAPPGDTTDQALRSRLAAGSRKEMDRRLLDANLLTYDGLISRLAAALERPGRGDAAVERLRRRFRTVLVDEFQDTDLDQWRVVERAFGAGTTRLVLIGDPKQAIYGFRGADVQAYLSAARAAGRERQLTLSENWRADSALVDAIDALLWPLHLGDTEIRYEKPRVPQARAGSASGTEPALQPLRFRLVGDDVPDLVATRNHLVTKRSAQLWVAKDLAADICRLLASGTTLPSGPGRQQGTQPRPLGPGDIGVLVRTNRQALVVQDALRERAVAVVVAGAQSVLSTVSADHWLQLLSALEQPSSRSLAVAVALSDFVGAKAAELADAPDARWEELHERLHEWAALARSAGVATLFSHVTAQTDLPGRLLAQVNGERRLTDLAHVAELLHAEGRQHQLGISALRAWLARHVEDQVRDGVDAEQRSRRLDSDADAVHILTVHRAKGLEFPVVYCPFAWDGTSIERAGGPIVFHDEEAGGVRSLDVGGDAQAPEYRRHWRACQAEQRGEELRHLYVALTRARHQVVLWWAPVKDCQHSALGRLLFNKDAHGDVSPSGLASAPRYQAVRQRLELVAERAHGLVGVEDASQERGRAPAPDVPAARGRVRERPVREGPGEDLGAAVLARGFDQSWQRASYSSILAEGERLSPGPGAGVVSSEPEGALLADEPDLAPAGALVGGPKSAAGRVPAGGRVPSGSDAWAGEEVPLASVPGGAEVGTLVHSVLEAVDFTLRPSRAALSAALAGCAGSYSGPAVDGAVVVEGLARCLEAPLGGPLGDFSLAAISRRDRVDELRFEMPLAGGDQPAGSVSVPALAECLRRHLPAGTSLAGYPDQLARLGPQELRGYLTGSLDLVFRAPTPEGSERYYVADYKTNRLAGNEERLVYGHYSSEALEAQMLHSHYALQALVYLVALHRYLLWRLPGYRAQEHLGGAAYLFLRGMGRPGDGPPAGHGVFWWCPPPALVEEASDLFAGPGPARRDRVPPSRPVPAEARC